MFPNPQEALPLPPRPSLAQYRKRAKDLVRACRSGQPQAVRMWATRWVAALAALQPDNERWNPEDIERSVDQVTAFAEARLSPIDRQTPTCGLADAQFVIARAHGFASWPKLAAHLDSLAHTHSHVSAFEAAADAIVAGDVATVEHLLREHPDLIRTRSTREHDATLLHYLSANGVENFRQKSPKNAARLAELLLEAGSDVDAVAEVYGGGATTLGLVATSVHPHKAGVQKDLIDVLVNYGARLDDQSGAGNKHNLVNGCLANGRGEAAEYLAGLGAPLDLEGAAGVGRTDVARGFFNDDGSLKATATTAQLKDGFARACEYGGAEVVEFLLQHGMELGAQLRHHGQTGLHCAAYGGHADIVKALVRRGAPVDVTDETFGATPLAWALFVWSESHAGPPERYHETVATLIRAGAVPDSEWLRHEKVRADLRMSAALSGSGGTPPE